MTSTAKQNGLNQEERYLIRAVGQAFNLVEALAEGPRTLTELGQQFSLNSNTSFRQASTLLASGWAELRSDGRYCLSRKVAELGLHVARSLSVTTVRDQLPHIAKAMGCTALLWHWNGESAVCLDGTETGDKIRVLTPLGDRLNPGERRRRKINNWFSEAGSASPVFRIPVTGAPQLVDVISPVARLDAPETMPPLLVGVRALVGGSGHPDSLAVARRLTEILKEQDAGVDALE